MGAQQAATRKARTTPLRSAVPKSRWIALIVVGASLLLLIPCFWQSRIQAGDLSSHVYNVWLAGEIQAGKLPGLIVVSQWNNVLFDWSLGKLVQVAGYALGQRIAVAAAVLLFFWCAFAFVSVVSKRRPWHMMVPLALLAYGWVFHMGFLNCYVSVAFSLAALAICWRGPSMRSLWAVPLLAVGTLAHALPVAWAVGAIVHVWVIRRFRDRAPFAPFVAATLALVGLTVALSAGLETRHSSQQILSATGADQVIVFGTKYMIIALGMLLFWFALWRDMRKHSGYGRLLASPSFQLFAITGLTIVILPAAVFLPRYEHGLMYIADRMSLIIAVLVCAMLGRVVPSRAQKVWIVCIALLFFAWIYRDTARANATETEIEAALSQVPEGARVLSSFQTPGSRVNPLGHAVDRACIGRCFSYGNYEASTRQFRVRATRPNAYVAWRYEEADAIQNGTYVVQPQDLPAYQVEWCEGTNKICVQRLAAGAPNGAPKP